MNKDRIVILGAGESGVGAALLAQKEGYDVFVSDYGKINSKFEKELLENGISFEENGHTVVEAPNGVVAIDLLEKNIHYDLILLDWEMPVMDGLTFLTIIKEENVAPDTKVVMLTSLSKMSNIVKAMDAGADEYIMKPFTPQILLDKIAATM